MTQINSRTAKPFALNEGEGGGSQSDPAIFQRVAHERSRFGIYVTLG